MEVYCSKVCSSGEEIDTALDHAMKSVRFEKQNLTEEQKSIVRENIGAAQASEGGTAAKIGEVTLLASAWVGSDNLYSQVVSITGVTERSQVDLTPDVQQLVVFYQKDITFVTENEDGVVTVYAIGQKPTNDYTIQVTITEVNV